MRNRIAVSLALPDTAACLRALTALAPRIGLAEIRLDLMESFDLAGLIGGSPCPLIITCRPLREGGRFAGSEAERLAILERAVALGCAYVDLEWDSLGALGLKPGGPTRLIASRHWYDVMPPALGPFYQELRERADVVKLVGTARRPTEVLPVFELLRDAAGPLIAIAMGRDGQLTRVLAPCFDACLLTYAAHAPSAATAPGQLTVDQMFERYHLHAVGPHTLVALHLCADAASAEAVVARNQGGGAPGERLDLPLLVTLDEAPALVADLRACLPRLVVTADPALGAAL